MENVKDTTVIGIFIMLFGLAIGIYGAYCAYKKRRCTQIVTATCVDIETSYRSYGRSHVCIFPVWQFRWKKKLYRVTDSVGSSLSLFGVGRRTELLINPDDPEEISRKGTRWTGVFIGTAILLAGLCCVILSVIRPDMVP
ncbi:MAG: DUF3592 domain-containing protein [Oscillospiraceae bacterium]|nr:DUF3592 domain-containing protein [Oscillospiraceae bacterium]